jgi:Flp pilus assembly CpaE family ATPase
MKFKDDRTSWFFIGLVTGAGLATLAHALAWQLAQFMLRGG